MPCALCVLCSSTCLLHLLGRSASEAKWNKFKEIVDQDQPAEAAESEKALATANAEMVRHATSE